MAALVKLDSRIVILRGVRVMIDADLASAYGVSTRALNQAVKRNRTRFPADFAFQATRQEAEILRSQIVISNGSRGGRRTRPWAYTEHGAIMAASVLNSRRAADMSVFVVRAFIRLRQAALDHAQLASKLFLLEQRVGRHDKALGDVLAALRRMVQPSSRQKRAIGFRS